MKKIITESEVEEICLELLEEQGYQIIHGPDIAEDGINPERKYNEVILENRLKQALKRINDLPEEAIEQAIKKLKQESQNLIKNNQDFHKLVTEGIPIEYKKEDRIKHDNVNLFDFKNIDNNEFLAINQFTVIENRNKRRPDIILFINGLPLVTIELKNPAEEKATAFSAFKQFQTYKQEIPSLFKFNEILIASDGIEAKAGTITSQWERFSPWKTINHKKQSKHQPQIETLIKGMLNKITLLDLIRHFIVFEKEKTMTKKLAAYHQYNAVNKAVESTIKATKTNKKAGIVWHTQGSGKSLSMVFYAGKLVLTLDNPTIILLTDRNDLDDQLFGTFGRCKELLRQKPNQADSRGKLKELLKVASGGVVFTTIQKFFPEGSRESYEKLSDRSNIIVIADEAHRSQYGFQAKVLKKEDKAEITYGYAKYLRDALPNASFIGFTGTPIERADKSTPAVFGKYVDVYDIEQAVEDGATVKIYYEPRLAKLDLKPEERPLLDQKFEEVTEQEEQTKKEKLKSKWARLEAVVGSKKRIRKIAKDIITHFEERNEILEGKAMIVGMSRRICVDLYKEITKLKPEWHNEDDKKGSIKVIMTGSASDPKEWQQHIRNKQKRRELGDRFKKPEDDFKIAIVRDMWLTGFDVPSLHTMYLDKPMKGHTLMQAIARVNRIYKDKDGGRVVDYLGVGTELKKAVMDYTESGGEGKPIFDQDQAVALMLEKYEIVTQIFHGFNYKKFFKLKSKEKLAFMNESMEHILKQKQGKERFLKQTTLLLRAFALAVPDEEAMKIKEEVGFFQALKAIISKNIISKGKPTENLDSAINQILSKAIVSDRIVDIFAAAGLKKPDISILSEGFLSEVKDMPQKNLAFEMLKKLLNDQIKMIMKKNVVKGRSFMEMLEKTIRRYTNQNIEAAQVVDELIDLAKKVKKEDKRSKNLGLTEDEIAFYDALANNDSAVEVLGDETLKKIAKELTELVRKNTTIDWTMKESIQAKLRVLVRRLLRKYGYPPDKQQRATELVLEQAKVVCNDVANGD